MAGKKRDKARKIDDDALAEVYERALSLEKTGAYDEAAAAYRKLLALDPQDHGGVTVRMASFGHGESPDKAPAPYVATLFDQHADIFDEVLVEQLGYAVPMMVRQILQARGLGPFDRLLDLGCGTGLTGSALEDMVDDATGVDLSERMIEIALERNVYDTLYVDEAISFLEEIEDDPWDLVTATDMLPYLGDLKPLFSGVAGKLVGNGIFVFSSETLPAEALAGRPYKVGPHQRFAHDEAYIRSTLDMTGLDLLDLRNITVRMENGTPAPGHLIIARRRTS